MSQYGLPPQRKITTGSPAEPINEPSPRFLGHMPPGSSRCAIAISWIFYIFTPTTNCQLPRTTNCHNAHAQQAPQRARSRSKWRRGGERPTPDAYRTPNGAYPGAGALVNYGRKLSPRILLPQTGDLKKSSLRKGALHAKHGISDIVSISGLITIEGVDIKKVLS